MHEKFFTTEPKCKTVKEFVNSSVVAEFIQHLAAKRKKFRGVTPAALGSDYTVFRQAYEMWERTAYKRKPNHIHSEVFRHICKFLDDVSLLLCWMDYDRILPFDEVMARMNGPRLRIDDNVVMANPIYTGRKQQLFKGKRLGTLHDATRTTLASRVTEFGLTFLQNVSGARRHKMFMLADGVFADSLVKNDPHMIELLEGYTQMWLPNCMPEKRGSRNAFGIPLIPSPDDPIHCGVKLRDERIFESGACDNCGQIWHALHERIRRTLDAGEIVH